MVGQISGRSVRTLSRSVQATMKQIFKELHMAVAQQYARLSSAKRRQVGCVIVLDGVVFPGYNGTPEGWDNTCETPDGSATLPEVIHAEQNALDKIPRSTLSSVGAIVFVTTAPCFECAKRLHGAKVKEVYYQEIYRTDAGVEFLKSVGIHVEHVAGVTHGKHNTGVKDNS